MHKSWDNCEKLRALPDVYMILIKSQDAAATRNCVCCISCLLGDVITIVFSNCVPRVLNPQKSTKMDTGRDTEITWREVQNKS